MSVHHAERDVIISLYRSLLRMGKKFDEKPLTRALISYPLPFSFQVLLGGIDRDFYGNNMSVQMAIKGAFRHTINYENKLKTIDDFHGVREKPIFSSNDSSETFHNDGSKEKMSRKANEEENELQLKIDLALKSNATFMS